MWASEGKKDTSDKGDIFGATPKAPPGDDQDDVDEMDAGSQPAT